MIVQLNILLYIILYYIITLYINYILTITICWNEQTNTVSYLQFAKQNPIVKLNFPLFCPACFVYLLTRSHVPFYTLRAQTRHYLYTLHRIIPRVPIATISALLTDQLFYKNLVIPTWKRSTFFYEFCLFQEKLYCQNSISVCFKCRFSLKIGLNTEMGSFMCLQCCT